MAITEDDDDDLDEETNGFKDSKFDKMLSIGEEFDFPKQGNVSPHKAIYD